MRNNALATLLALAFLSVPAAGFQLCEQDLDSPLAAPLSGRFGRSVSASGPWVVVGAPRLFGSSATVGGSAVVYRRDSASDRLDFVVELSASDSTPDDRFGESVSIDDSRLVVGARRAESGAGTRGAAYVFEESGGVWNETQKIVPSTPASASNFGFSVGLSGDRIVVGQSAATVEVHRLDASGTWTLEEAVVADGEDVDIDGLTFSTLSGVFRRDPVFGSWIQEFSYTATSSAVNGDTVFYFDGSSARIAERDPVTGIWSGTGVFGVSLNSARIQDAGPGLFAVSGVTGGIVQERVRIFGDGFPTATGFAELRVLSESEPGVSGYGSSVAIDGDRLVVGAEGSGIAGTSSGRIYQYDLRCEPIQAETSCFQDVRNSTGATARLDAFGSRSIALDDVTLEASLLPPFTFGIFVTSLTEGLSVMPGGSQGNLCLAGAIGRYVAPGQIVSSGADGRFSLELDLDQTPTPSSFISIVAGNRYFQAWHRDVNPGQTSNFTDAIRVNFTN
ncbi:MAG: hypothetical protein AAFZ87_04330 [Planctomycetota bacterium]